MPDEDPPRQQGKDYFHPSRFAKKEKPAATSSFPKKAKIIPPRTLRWAVTIVAWTFVISVTLAFVSDRAMEGVSLFVAFLLLLCFILLGVLFDILGLAVATAAEKPFHSMASRRVKGSVEALKLIRRADRVSSFCNDVVGDICGVLSGSVGAMLSVRFALTGKSAIILPLFISGLIAALTVGGKALGKSIALRQNTAIVLFVGKLLYAVGALRRELFSGKN